MWIPPKQRLYWNKNTYSPLSASVFIPPKQRLYWNGFSLISFTHFPKFHRNNGCIETFQVHYHLKHNHNSTETTVVLKLPTEWSKQFKIKRFHRNNGCIETVILHLIFLLLLYYTETTVVLKFNSFTTSLLCNHYNTYLCYFCTITFF